MGVQSVLGHLESYEFHDINKPKDAWAFYFLSIESAENQLECTWDTQSMLETKSNFINENILVETIGLYVKFITSVFCHTRYTTVERCLVLKNEQTRTF